MHAIIRRYDAVDQTRTAELTDKVNETLVPQLTKLPRLQGLLPDRGRQRHPQLARSLRDLRAGRGVLEGRRRLGPRRELERAAAERAQDHDRQGRRSQHASSRSPSSI